MTEWAVETVGLTRRFGAFTAVDGISLQVRRGEIFGFLGANGAGKTTVIRMLCGLLLPSEGRGWVNGNDIYKESEQIKRSIGYMSQKFSPYEDLTVWENIQFFGSVYRLSRKRIQEKTQAIEDRLNLQGLLTMRTASLPLGWKQRLAMVCATLHDPLILFLDEPTSGVDPISRRQFWEFINELSRGGTTVFVTTHFMDEAEYCNRICIMYEGSIIALDAPSTLKESYHMDSIQDVFIHLVDRPS